MLEHRVRKSANYSTIIFTTLVLFSIVVGWFQREEYWLTAEKGLGYALGIIGGSLMLILLLYPVRKHWKVARHWFSIRYWFQMHMVLGVVGPLLILFHSNFHLGSLNSNIALFSMIIVSASGVIGRYAYQKTHKGLYGAKIEFSELKNDYQKSKAHFSSNHLLDKKIEKQLAEIEHLASRAKVPFFSALFGYRKIKRVQRSVISLSREKTKMLVSNKTQLRAFVDEAKILIVGIGRLKKMASYALFSRLFSLWHVFHLPLFFMMLIAGFVHVFVVHIY